MKRLICTLICLCFGLGSCLTFVGCTERDPNTIRLAEVTRSVFYAPMYIAIDRGFFEDEGIDIQLTTTPGASNVMAAIISKSADIGLMGPEASIYCHIQGQADYPIVFGQLTKRDGSFLIGRTDQAATFEWSDLAGRHTIAGRAGGVPAMTLEYVMNQNKLFDGVDGTIIDTSIQFENIIHEYTNYPTKYDYCTMFEPQASEYVAEGKGFIVASVGQASGEVPFTAFAASKSYLSANRDQATKFLRAVYRGYKYMMSNVDDLSVVAPALQSHFPATSIASLTRALQAYVQIDAWCATPIMTQASFDRLLAIMKNAGELDGKVDFAKVVDNSIALDVIA